MNNIRSSSGYILVSGLFRNNYKSLLFVYILFILESTLLIFYPLVLGNSIDYFVKGEYYYVIYLIIVLGGFIITTYFRRIYDTKVFTTIYRKLILEYINNEINKGRSTSTINARVRMLNSIVDFLEVDLPYIFHSLFTIIGSLIIIILNYNIVIGFIILITLVPILLVSKYYSKLLSVKYSESNDLSEKDVDILDTINTRDIKHHYINKNFLQIRISNINANNNLFNDIINYSLIIIILIIFTILDNPSIGDIVGIHQYVLKFIGGALTIPHLILRFEYLKDVLKRIEK